MSPEKKKRQIVRRQIVSQEKKEDNSAKTLIGPETKTSCELKKRKELDNAETL